MGAQSKSILIFLVALILVSSVLAIAIYANFLSGVLTHTTSNSCSLSFSYSGGEGKPTAQYTRQMFLALDGKYNSIVYNVSAVEQSDTFGYGPSYLLNGLSDKLYWYQVGLAWNGANGNLSGYTSGFSFIYEVWNISSRQSIYPPDGGAGGGAFHGRINNADVVAISLNFSGGNVTMAAYDWNSGVRASASYSAYGASTFLGGNQTNVTIASTGVMTEWHQVCANFVGAKNVTYWNSVIPAPSARICIDESDLAPSSIANGQSSNGRLLFANCSSRITYDATEGLQSFSFKGITVYSDAHRFITD
ncbi:MAG TPA: hypothetical protein VFF30_10735 [Nitrososphaerales archaeon]|nr:hypothetical protein [Nitrososphaerales archaeon]